MRIIMQRRYDATVSGAHQPIPRLVPNRANSETPCGKMA
jgi:hypothetical protein